MFLSFLGGGIYGEAGFIGCMRHITIDGNYKLPSDWKDQEISSRDDIVLESCHVTDRCTPNPCEHAGVCKQNSDEFYCECEGTGYTGAVCHTSLNFLSCVQYSHAHPESRYVRFCSFTIYNPLYELKEYLLHKLLLFTV